MILYEASYHFDFAYLIPIFLFVGVCFFPKIMKWFREQLGMSVDEELLKEFNFVSKAVVGLFIVITIIVQISQYNKVVVPYKNGDYKTVEGYVEDYVPMPYGGHADESFSVDGVEFSYSDFAITQGYNNAASHGGVITHNGQHLKLGYVTTGAPKENVIVYIEELP